MPRLGGRPPGRANKRTTAIGHTLDAAYSKVTRTLLDDVIPDRQLAQLLWKLALEGDGRVATYLADRKWGKVKLELEHQVPTPLVLMMGRTTEEHLKNIQGFQYGPWKQLPSQEGKIAGPRTIDAVPVEDEPEDPSETD